MKLFLVVPILLLAASLAPAAAARANDPPISYVESSQGLIPPTLDGGRTEVEFGDVNADGDVDLVSIGDHGCPYVNTDEHGIMVWFGDGRGAWTVAMTGDFGYGGIALGDLDGDGRLDAAYAMHHDYGGAIGDQLVEAALSDGTGRNWTAWDQGLGHEGESWGMFGTDLADIDNDGRLDIGANSFGCCDGEHVYHNNGDGTWTHVWGFLGGNSNDDFTFGDVNADGFADLAVAHDGGTVYLGDGAGHFTNADGNLPPGGASGRSGLSLGDVDNDGRLDIVYVGSGGSLQVWLFRAPGTWVNASAGLPTSGIEATQVADMDGDGHADIVALGSSAIRIWLGNGGLAWTLAATIPLPSPGSFSALRVGGDVDHNGRPDIAVVDDEGSWPSDHNHLHVFREGSVPAALAARVVRPYGGEAVAGGSAQFIDWITAVPGGIAARVAIDLSTSGPQGPWTTVAQDVPDNGRFQWRVPVVAATSNAYVRVHVSAGQNVVEAANPRPFSILPPTAASVGGDAPALPAAGRAWPNPSRETVRLDFAAGRPVGEIRILDAGGALVRVLPAGADRWDGRDDRGRDAPPGLYVARCGGGSVRIVRLR